MSTGSITTSDVSNLAQALGEARRVRYGLPVLIGARAGISIFAIGAGGGAVFETMSWIGLLSSAAAALILAVFDGANIRGRPLLTRLLLGYIALSVICLGFDAVHVAAIVLPGLAGGERIALSDELGDAGIFVLMFGLLSWIVLMIARRAAKALRLPIDERERAILAAAPVSLPTLRMGVRNAVTVVAAVVVAFGFMMVVGLLRSASWGEVWETIRKKGLGNMARELAAGLSHGETAAIGVTVVFLVGAAILLLKLYERLAPRQAPLSRMWRWAKDARTALATDRRAPVLLLRSFADEALGTQERPSDFSANVEGAIGRAVSGLGPFVAIGAPGEAEPGGRAYRTYLKDDEWQEAVLGWIRESQLIVVVLGLTHWVRWELDAIRSEDQLGKTLILLPPTGDKERVARWILLEDALSATLWRPALGSVEDRCGALLLELKPGGRLGVVRSDLAGRDDYHAAVLCALRDRLASLSPS